ncbi:uncharacterized protein LOC112557839 [Pomacea canaliculata]|uniref:uncharacterized protein LOC112557839 n=1 Tax=Pomacea canaliculata TaxID=400727 RepID=UPI000D73C3CF|nr:uncharacterized protein LOC112557839 [Pomacea canaliculata]XP_025083699.1 uncharacterized protein LOC112557839 [Pomacea canaliculata]XP_025083700.1 uncharacterized protein LOC112557839 [Pomacea canaliculata]
MAAKYRDQALMELKKASDDLEKVLAADTQRVQDELNSLLKLQSRAQLALSSTCDTEVLQVEREMTRGEGSSEQLREREDGLPVTTYRPVLHGDFYNYIEDHYMKTFIGSPVKQIFPSKKTVDIVREGRFGDGGCREVHAMRQREDGSIDVFYGGTGGDYTKEKGVNVNSDGSRGPETDYGMRISCVTRKDDILPWEEPSFCHLGSKNKSMHLLSQHFETGVFSICSMKDEETDEKETLTLLLSPQLHRGHNFDSNEQGTFFAVVDEDENKNSDDESMRTNENKEGSRRYRVVRLYSNKSDDPIATYTEKNFFPSDVNFCGEDVLLIADWMNDCVHVTRVSDRGIEFVCFLPGSGDMVRPTALNLDLNGQLLIGCGDGWVLRVSVDY